MSTREERLRQPIEHKWAHNTNPDRYLTEGNKYVRGFMIQHYATPIACLYPDKKYPGKESGTVVMNSHTYRSQTSKFQSHIRHAIPATWHIIHVNSDRFWRGDDYVSNLRCVKYALEKMYGDQEELVKKLKAAKLKSTRANLWHSINYAQSQIEPVAKFLGRRPKGLKRFELDIGTIDREASEYDAAQTAKREARWAKDREENDRRKALRDAELLLTREERIAKWRSGEACYTHMSTEDIMLRFSKDGRRVQTSRGVEVTLRDALELFKVAKVVHDGDPADPAVAAFATRVTNAQKQVGLYTLNQLHCNGDVTVGCHFIRYGEMEQLFNKLTDEQKAGIHESQS